MSRSALTVQVVGNIERERERSSRSRQRRRVYTRPRISSCLFFFPSFSLFSFIPPFSSLLSSPERRARNEEKRRVETYLEEKNHPRSALSRNYSRGDPSRPIFIPFSPSSHSPSTLSRVSVEAAARSSPLRFLIQGTRDTISPRNGAAPVIEIKARAFRWNGHVLNTG